MTAAILAFALQAQPECKIKTPRVEIVAREIINAEKKYKLPEGVLASVVLAESGGLSLLARRRGKNKIGCDVGPAQIHVPACARERLQRMLILSVNLDEGARLLAKSRRTCRAHPSWRACKRGVWSLYNAGSMTWSARVKNIWHRLMRSAEQWTS